MNGNNRDKRLVLVAAVITRELYADLGLTYIFLKRAATVNELSFMSCLSVQQKVNVSQIHKVI